MGASELTILFFTTLWGVIGIGGSLLAPHGPNRQLTQCILVLTSGCCWLFWLCCYMAQMNPLIGPRLSRHTISLIAQDWGMPLKEG